MNKLFDFLIAIFAKFILGPNVNFYNLSRRKQVAISVIALGISGVLVALFGFALVSSYSSMQGWFNNR
ncbi:MAG: hypothetical protein KA715_08615 [Xanthomonadaceae bacterium]|nr:hypothetical protein [Xanthomonadaceae bacterium]